MASMDTISFNSCEDTKSLQVDVFIEDEGHLLKVPVYLHNVRPCTELIVGVFVYVDDKFYAMKTRSLFTGGRPYCHKIYEFYAGDFFFLFTNERNKQIRAYIMSHYIY